MGAYQTRLSANIAVDYMESVGFVPKTLLNIGIGCCPELSVWRRRLSGVALLGVDVRYRKWDAPRVVAAVGDVANPNGVYCIACRSMMCHDPAHDGRRSSVQVRTIDDIIEETKSLPPFFLWMDIEGSELDALRGATATLLQTPLISIEMREFPFSTDYCQHLHAFLVDAGYREIDISSKVPSGVQLDDKLYSRTA